ncbi:MAG: DUF2818 domain-containing protein [Variovorax paradoxus]|uniref:DUF2818 domain-containing protein n=1 Tax=Variovorax paradoxus TaxID=34073 RepID=A0A2W5RVD2_VARPD|nr:MAG: DUF2818 domain-containing protein [Variovorax paradoxus]
MSQSASVWLVLLVAVLAANLPFLTERLLGVLPVLGGQKSLAWRLAELAVLYGLTGAVGLLFERRLGQIAPQGWEFYAVTGALFLVLAFPGFTWRYLVKHRAAA